MSSIETILLKLNIISFIRNIVYWWKYEDKSWIYVQVEKLESPPILTLLDELT